MWSNFSSTSKPYLVRPRISLGKSLKTSRVIGKSKTTIHGCNGSFDEKASDQLHISLESSNAVPLDIVKFTNFILRSLESLQSFPSLLAQQHGLVH